MSNVQVNCFHPFNGLFLSSCFCCCCFVLLFHIKNKQIAYIAAIVSIYWVEICLVQWIESMHEPIDDVLVPYTMMFRPYKMNTYDYENRLLSINMWKCYAFPMLHTWVNCKLCYKTVNFYSRIKLSLQSNKTREKYSKIEWKMNF